MLQLEYFDTSVQHDQEAIIPFIREAMATAAADRTYPSSSGPSIRLVASPWSPPAWMKVAVSTNSSDPKIAPVQSMLGSAQPNGLLADAQQIWAEYLSKFITAYSDQDVSIWAITPQNEPENAAAWEACVYTAEFEAEFITNYLGPTIRNAHPEVLYC